MAEVGPVGLGEVRKVLAERLRPWPWSRRRALRTGPRRRAGPGAGPRVSRGVRTRRWPSGSSRRNRARTRCCSTSARGAGRRPARRDRAGRRRALQLRLARRRGDERVYLSFPRLDISESRPRVPSLYALEVWRAMTGRVPAEELQQAAPRRRRATLAWPAPADRAQRSTRSNTTWRRCAAGRRTGPPARGRAHYMLRAERLPAAIGSRALQRGTDAWSHWDGITRRPSRGRALDTQRLGAALLAVGAAEIRRLPVPVPPRAIFRLGPREDLEPLQRMDPLTRGSLFHACRPSFYARSAKARLPMTPAAVDHALATLRRGARGGRRRRVRAAGAGDRSGLARRDRGDPARPAPLGRRDRRRAGGWMPKWFEWASACRTAGPRRRQPGRAGALDGRFSLHGSIDLVERDPGERSARDRSQDRKVPRPDQ